MASYEKRGKRWRVQVKKNGIRLSDTFDTKAKAQEWAAQQESDIASQKRGSVPNKIFGDLLDRYGSEVSPTKKGELWELKRINVLKTYKIASVRLSSLDEVHVSEWRNDRLKDVSSASVLRDWNLLSHACEIARREWKWLVKNPFREVKRPKDSKPRDKVYSQDEIDRLCLAMGYVEGKPLNLTQQVAVAFLFALETAMRAGEILGIQKEHIFPSYVHIPDSKNDQKRDVPLTSKAKELIAYFPLSITATQRDSLFRKAKRNAVVDGRFHDSRRTALTRLAKIYQNPMELAKISGHKDLRILMNTYYSPSIEDLASRLT